MKVIIAGSREIQNYGFVLEAIEEAGFPLTEVVSGTANGIDRLGERYANENHIPIAYYPADWDKYGKSAGYRRNIEMANYAEGLIAVWNRKSKGTASMIELARDRRLKTYVFCPGNQYRIFK